MWTTGCILIDEGRDPNFQMELIQLRRWTRLWWSMEKDGLMDGHPLKSVIMIWYDPVDGPHRRYGDDVDDPSSGSWMWSVLEGWIIWMWSIGRDSFGWIGMEDVIQWMMIWIRMAHGMRWIWRWSIESVVTGIDPLVIEVDGRIQLVWRWSRGDPPVDEMDVGVQRSRWKMSWSGVDPLEVGILNSHSSTVEGDNNRCSGSTAAVGCCRLRLATSCFFFSIVFCSKSDWLETFKFLKIYKFCDGTQSDCGF